MTKIEELEKQVAEIQTAIKVMKEESSPKEEKLPKPMYEKPNRRCKCDGSGYILSDAGGDSYCNFYDKLRCQCTKIKTQEYLNSKVSEHSQFYDNNTRYNNIYAMDSY